VRLPEVLAPEYERFLLQEGDIVLSLDPSFIVTGTRVARITARDLPALLLQRVGRLMLSPELHPDFLFLLGKLTLPLSGIGGEATDAQFFQALLHNAHRADRLWDKRLT
jgi:hypothetical protein